MEGVGQGDIGWECRATEPVLPMSGMAWGMNTGMGAPARLFAKAES